MLLREDSTWTNPRTGLMERVFPSNFASPGFESASPTVDELRGWFTDPALVSRLRSTGDVWLSRSVFGNKEAPIGLPLLVGLRLYDFARAQESRILQQATKVGLVRAEDVSAVATTANALISGLVDILQTDSHVLARDIGKQLAFEFYRAVSGLIGATSPQLALALSVIGFGVEIANTISIAARGEAQIARARLPLRTFQDKQYSDDGRVDAIRHVMALSRDWTTFFLPSDKGRFHLFEAGEWPGQVGFAVARSESSDESISGNDGAFGFMPGTARTLDVLQFQSRWLTRRDEDEDRRWGKTVSGFGKTNAWEPLATWASHYCTGNKDPCWQTIESFSGSEDCRQCITINSIRGSTRGDFEKYSHGAGVGNRFVNLGDWLINSTQSLAALIESCTVTNPISWCFDTETMQREWYRRGSDFFQFIAGVWNQHDSYAWRTMVASIGAWGLVSLEDGRIAGAGTLLDWRVRRWGEYDFGITLGQEVPGVPPVYSDASNPDVLAARTILMTPFLWANSVYERAIRPAIERLTLVQLRGYETTMVAYLWQDQGAHWDASTGKLRNNPIGKAYEDNLRQLLNTPSLLGAVDMGHVVDPTVKQLLLEAGARPFQSGATIQASPAAIEGSKPPRVGISSTDPIKPLRADWAPPPPGAPPVGGFPGQVPSPSSSSTAEDDEGGGWLLAALGVGAAVGLGALAFRGRRGRGR